MIFHLITWPREHFLLKIHHNVFLCSQFFKVYSNIHKIKNKNRNQFATRSGSVARGSNRGLAASDSAIDVRN